MSMGACGTRHLFASSDVQWADQAKAVVAERAEQVTLARGLHNTRLGRRVRPHPAHGAHMPRAPDDKRVEQHEAFRTRRARAVMDERTNQHG